MRPFSILQGRRLSIAVHQPCAIAPPRTPSRAALRSRRPRRASSRHPALRRRARREAGRSARRYRPSPSTRPDDAADAGARDGDSTSTTKRMGVVVPSTSSGVARMPAGTRRRRHTPPMGTGETAGMTDRSTPAGIPDRSPCRCTAASSPTRPETGESPGCGGHHRDRTSDGDRAARGSDRRPRLRSRKTGPRGRMNVEPTRVHRR